MSLPTYASVSAPTGPAVPPYRRAALLRGPSSDPAWARPALIALLAATTVLYVWGLGASQWANGFYSAAVQAGAHSWKAFFFGSSDAANFITVDKTPLALWPMDLAARLFGVSSWSILVPQALMGVATVAVLFATVRRSLRPLGPRAAAGGALLAGAVLATTPVAALMFRYNNPDALLVLLLTLGAYSLLRARETASTRWLVLAATCVGLGFLAKMLQAFLVVPAFALVYLTMAPTRLRRRLWQLAVATATLVVSAGWWVAIVAAIPADSRPYIGGSQHNSVLELALGYNGIGRLNGNETGGLGNTNQDAGWTRMFGAELGGQIGWLLPAAFALLAAGLWATITHRRLAAVSSPAGRSDQHHAAGSSTAEPRPADSPEAVSSRRDSGDRATPAPAARPTGVERGDPLSGLRTDSGLAAFALWGGWLLVTDVVFSLMQGIFHAYYTVALAPSIAALIGMGAAGLWVRRRGPAAAIALAVVIALTAWWSYRLLGRTPSFDPWLRLPVLVAGLIAAATPPAARWLPGRVLVAGAIIACATSLAGPAAYAVDTATTAHRGAIPSAGPGGMRGPGGFPGGPGRSPGTRAGRNGLPGGTRRVPVPGGTHQPPNGGQIRPPGQNPGTGGGPMGGRGPGMGGGGMRGPGALLAAATPSAALTALLKQDAGSYTWAAATVGSNSAAGYQLATGDPIMAIGGFNGTDPAPTLARFQQYVHDGKVHYFVTGTTAPGGRGGRGGTGSNDAQQIASWVAQTFPAKTVDGTTVYDLG